MAEINNDHDMDNLLRGNAETEVPLEVQARLRRSLADFRKRIEQAEEPAIDKGKVIALILAKTTSRKIRWMFTAAAVLLFALLAALNPWERGPGRVYAAAAQQMRAARTMTCAISVDTGMPGTVTTQGSCMFKEPGYLRETISTGDVTIADLTQNKFLLMLGSTKQFTEMSFDNMPDKGAQISFIEEMKRLPERANEALGERTIDGRTVQLFRVTEGGFQETVWVDAKTCDLVRIEGKSAKNGGMGFVMTDFRFDVDLDDSLFSLSPPEGYTRLLSTNLDMSNPSEDDLVRYLRWFAERIGDNSFPSSLKPEDLVKECMEKAASVMKPDGTKRKWEERDPEVAQAKAEMDRLGAVLDERKLDEVSLRDRAKFDEWKKAADEWSSAGKQYSQAVRKRTRPERIQEDIQTSMEMARGVLFADQLKPENDWHYAGDGVRFGDANTPICWYKPTRKSDESTSASLHVWRPGADTYRVVYGDLSVRDVAPKDLPSR